MLRRSELPYELTEGYHKRPRLSFSPALPLGLTSNCEVVVISLKEPLNPEEVRRKISEQAPRGLKVIQVEEGEEWRQLVSSQELWAEYVLSVEFRGAGKMSPEEIAARIKESRVLPVPLSGGKERDIRGGVATIEPLPQRGKAARFRAVLQVVGKKIASPLQLLRAIEAIGGPIESAHLCRTRLVRFSEAAERRDER